MMDNLDLEILRKLRGNSRESLGKIAEDLGVSKATVSRRIAKMEKDGYIAGYTIVLNPSRMGVMRALIILEVNGPAVNAVIDELKKFEEIEHIHKVFGDHSLICEVCAKSVDNLYLLIQTKLLAIPNIHNVEVDILIEKIALNPDADFDMVSSRASSS